MGSGMDEWLYAGAYNLERAVTILGLCHGILRTGLFLDTFQGTISHENRISNMSMSAFEV